MQNETWWLGAVGLFVIGWLGRKGDWGRPLMVASVVLLVYAYKRHRIQQAVEKSFALLD